MRPHEKIAGSLTKKPEPAQMDAERINLIGTTLTDLQARTADLRRYL
jgi:hypothetical protein